VDLHIEGRTALVTGSHRGTGAIIAARLAAEGANVIVHGFEPGQADAVAAGIPRAKVVVGDIASEAGTARVVTQCQTLTPVIDILVNNYGTAGPGSWNASDSDDWLDMYQRNVLSAQRLIRAFTPAMVERRWGRVINLGTVGSTRPNANSPHYYAAKGALANMTVSLARELGPHGVGVNLVSPGLIRTAEVEASSIRRGQREGWGSTWAEVEPHIANDIPIGRIVTREEVADIVAFLCSPRAAGIHGQNIRVDGGGLAIV
jgi:NAD(P)-dependent dehydrogenase (short-subunit alcohol dehydrogenase family)